METASGTVSAKNRRAAGHKRKQKYRNIKSIWSENAGGNGNGCCISWNDVLEYILFLFEISDNNINILKTISSWEKNNNNREAFLPDMYRQII